MIRTAALLASLLFAPDAADDQYQFIVGLADKGMHKLVITEAEDFLRKHPRHERKDLVRYRLAAALYETDRAGEAAPHFRALASKRGFRYEAEAAFQLGQCETAAKRFDDAIDAFTRVLELDKDYLHAPATFQIGEAAFQKGDHQEAAKRYRTLLQVDGDGEYARDARYGLAWTEYRLKQYDVATRTIDTFLSKHPRDALSSELRFLRGECLLEAGNAGDALKWYRQVDSGPFADAALRGAGFASAEMGDAKGAARYFGQLIRMSPKGRYAREATLQCAVQQIKAGQPGDAIATLSSDLAESDAEMLYWRAQARSKSSDAQGALRDIDVALAKRPDAALKERLQIARGDALFDLGRAEDAARAYSASNSDYALHAAAVASLNDGRTEEARRIAEQLTSRFPDSPYVASASHVLGECLLAAKQYDAAVARFETAIAGAADDEAKLRSRGRLAWAAYLGGDARKAAMHFQVVADSDAGGRADVATRAEARYMLGRAQEAAGNKSGAVQAFERYLKDHRQGEHRPDVLLALARIDPEGADDRLKSLIAQHGDHASTPRALFELAERTQADGDLAGAESLYARLIRDYPDHEATPPGRYGMAWCQYERERYKEAIATLRPLVADGAARDLAEASAELLVYAAQKAKNADVAADAFARFRKLCRDPERTLSVGRAAAQTLADAGRTDDADSLLADWQRTQRGSASPALLIERAWLALDRDAVDDAEAMALAARKAGGDGEPMAELCFFVAERLFDAGQDARAIALYVAAAADGGKFADKALYKEGFARLRNDDVAGAATRFAKLVGDHPKSPLFGESLFLLGECRYRQGRLEDAVAALTRLKSEAPRHQVIPKGLFRLGTSLARLKRFDEAEPVLNDLVRRFPDFGNLAEAELWRGRALAARGNARGARSAFDRVVAEDRGALAAQARNEIGRLLFDAGDTDKALSEFLKVSVLYSDPDAVAEGLYLAGLCLEKIGDRDRAKNQYQEIVSKYPSSTFAAQARKRLGEI